MIGFVRTGVLFDKCLNYCLSDKRELSENEKLQLSLIENVQHFDRSEILEFNKCFGDRNEILEQFADVSNLNQHVKKPLLHFSLRPAPGDYLSREQLIEFGQECAKEFGFADNHINVLHKDTDQSNNASAKSVPAKGTLESKDFIVEIPTSCKTCLFI